MTFEEWYAKGGYRMGMYEARSAWEHQARTIAALEAENEKLKSNVKLFPGRRLRMIDRSLSYFLAFCAGFVPGLLLMWFLFLR